MNITSDFKASTGWLAGFKERHGITGRTISGESNAVDDVTVNHWKTNVLPDIIKNYEERDIYNTDETGMFYNLLPHKTLARKDDPCHGGKRSKERLTVLLTTNADGSDKLRPLVTGKSKNPRCFKNVRAFPTEYDNNKNAWTTREIFRKFLRKLDRRMGEEKRKILLFLDRCSAHPTDEKLHNIRLEYFPANCSSKLQPLDLGIICNLKVHYRGKLVRQVISHLEAGMEKPNLNVLQVRFSPFFFFLHFS